MPQDLFTIKRTTKYLNQALSGAKISKVLQPNKDEVNLVLYKGYAFRLILSANAKFSRVAISNQEKQNPLTPPNFCMLLRKHLLGGEILNVEVVNDDRIIKISIKNQNDFLDSETYEIYSEIMGKYSNVFLTKNGTILGSIKQTPQDIDGKRLTLSGSKYIYPEKPNKISALNDSAKQILKGYQGGDIGRFILNSFYDFSPVTANEIAYRINGELKVFDSEKAYKIICDFISLPTNATVIKDGLNVDFYAVDYLSVLGEKTEHESLLGAIESTYSSLESKKDLQTHKNSLYTVINGVEKKLLKKQVTLNDRIIESENYENYKLFGELITSYCYAIKKGQKSAVLTNYTDDGEQKITVALDETLSPTENAQKYFKLYRKKKTTYSTSKEQVLQVEKELFYISTVKFSLDLASSIDDVLEIKSELILQGIIKEQKSKKQKDKTLSKLNYRKYLIQGYTVLVGKNNLQNDSLLSTAEKTDIWLHVKNYHSSHVIIKNNNQVPNEVIKISAEICAYFSQGNGGGKVEVDYTFKKNVKKQGGSKTASVFYTDYQSITVVPNENQKYLIN